MKLHFFILIFFAFITINVIGEEHRALIIGIDKYTPPRGTVISTESGRSYFQDLDGCKNDALAIQSLLEIRFGFTSQQIDTLYNEQATRHNILDKLNNLLNESKPGDVVFFYYAGHGSQQKNSKSLEADKKDETIVPSDTWKRGVGDIRDKEQAKIYNAFVDKGVKLTVMLDCCHSGSMSRGGPSFGRPKSRYLVASNSDANDPSNPPAPEAQGDNFLMISATQDNEVASEQCDDDKAQTPHGAFTLALLRALQQQPVDASVVNIVSAIRAMLQSSNCQSQEPQIAGSAKRQQMTLLGLKPGSLSNKILIPAQQIFKDGSIELLAGFAIGLHKKNQLTLMNDTSVVLVVDSIVSINKAYAKILKGNPAKLKSGQMFEVSNWVGEGTALLKVFIPENPFSYQDVVKMCTALKKIKETGSTTYIQSIGKYNFFDSYWYENGKLFTNKQPQPSNLDIENIQQVTKGDTVFFDLPAPRELISSINEKLAMNANIEITKNPLDAQYHVAGSLGDDGNPEYYFLQTNANVKDSLESMPLETNRLTLTGNTHEALDQVADGLYDYAIRLARVRGWLNVTTPNGNDFPFRLTIKTSDGKEVQIKNGLHVGQHAELHIVATAGLDRVRASLGSSFVYVFVIDRSGAMQLAYPIKGEQNRFPVTNDRLEIQKDVKLVSYTVSEPIGTDNFYLLASQDPIYNAAQLFTQKSIYRTRDASLKNRGPLDALLNAGTENTRGFEGETPANWNLLKLGVRSMH